MSRSTPTTEVELRIVAACAIVDRDGRVLIQQRPADRELAGLWEFPGGKLRYGETPERALHRELREEIGLDVETNCLAPIAFASHPSGGFHLLLTLFACRTWLGAPRPLEGQTLAWTRARRLRDYPMPPANANLLPFLFDWL